MRLHPRLVGVRSLESVTFSCLIIERGMLAGLDTLVGPIYTWIGEAESGNESLYLIIGRRFSELP